MPVYHPAFALIKHSAALAIIVACSMPSNAQSVVTKAFGEGRLTIPGVDGGLLLSTGDFNHDGYKDLLFGYDYPDNDFSVALGDSTGHFTLIGPFTPTTEYRGIAAGDVTGDGSIKFVLRSKNNDEVILFSANDQSRTLETINQLGITNSLMTALIQSSSPPISTTTASPSSSSTPPTNLYSSDGHHAIRIIRINKSMFLKSMMKTTSFQPPTTTEMAILISSSSTRLQHNLSSSKALAQIPSAKHAYSPASLTGLSRTTCRSLESSIRIQV